MHEFSVIQALIDQVEEIAREKGASKVVRIAIEVRDGSHFASDHLQDLFAMLRTTSPLLSDTVVDVRRSGSIPGEDVFLRDIELEMESSL